MYMLDTNIMIFAMRHPDTPCAHMVASHAGDDICISVITYSELEYGIMNSHNPVKNREAVSRILAGIPILDFDMPAGKHFGDILAKSKGIYAVSERNAPKIRRNTRLFPNRRKYPVPLEYHTRARGRYFRVGSSVGGRNVSKNLFFVLYAGHGVFP